MASYQAGKLAGWQASKELKSAKWFGGHVWRCQFPFHFS